MKQITPELIARSRQAAEETISKPMTRVTFNALDWKVNRTREHRQLGYVVGGLTVVKFRSESYVDAWCIRRIDSGEHLEGQYGYPAIMVDKLEAAAVAHALVDIIGDLSTEEWVE